LTRDANGLPPQSCNSDPDKAPDVVIWGDSHALAWRPFAWSVAGAVHASAAAFTLDSCPPVSNFGTHRDDFPEHQHNCTRFNALASRYIRDHHPDTVILAGRWLLYFQPRQEPGMEIQSPESMAVGIEESVAGIAPHVKRVVLMGPLPVMQETASKCVTIGAVDRCAMPRSRYDQLASNVWQVFARIAGKYPNVELVDPAEFFCDRASCPVLKDGYALYWDTNHVSSTAAGRFAETYLRDPDQWRAGSATPAQGRPMSH
jgi:hypothetical protein